MHCDICGRLLDNPDDMPASANCGGTCRYCMAVVAEDPDEIRNMGWTLEEEEE
jgi:hypothetical protein